MCHKRLDSKIAVESFLRKTHEILKRKNFNILRDFHFQRYRRNYSENNSYTNDSTLIELNYTVCDVVDEILSLTTENYKETFIDNKPGKENPFYCFIKTINGRQVYIKYKICENNKKQIFCVSFHFAEHTIKDNKLPYSAITN